MAEFHWQGAPGSSTDNEVRTQDVQFGDGYRQIQPDGINVLGQVFAVRFRRPVAQITAIDNFLKVKAGMPFTWMPPRGMTEIRVTCKKWTRANPDRAVDDLSAEFVRFYG